MKTVQQCCRLGSRAYPSRYMYMHGVAGMLASIQSPNYVESEGPGESHFPGLCPRQDQRGGLVPTPRGWIQMNPKPPLYMYSCSPLSATNMQSTDVHSSHQHIIAIPHKWCPPRTIGYAHTPTFHVRYMRTYKKANGCLVYVSCLLAGDRDERGQKPLLCLLTRMELALLCTQYCNGWKGSTTLPRVRRHSLRKECTKNT